MNNIRLILVEEKDKKKYERKYKCPYCEKKFTRKTMPPHIQNTHEDLIPEGMTALQITFNTVNNKKEPYGSCIVCKSNTSWNEAKGRYERLCGKESCKIKYKDMVASRNKDKYGTENPNTDERYKEDIQKKALSRRSISGNYKFKDGGVISYVGSYEKNLLEFMDKVMNINSVDIQAPGPSIKYQYKGEEHMYLPDFYYEPYDLLIEVKDGGDNPNKNPEIAKMKLERQSAKEKAIYDNTDFNYIRLTNNDFGQLMSAMAVLKYNLESKERYFKVNESFGGYFDMILTEEVGSNNIDLRNLEDIKNDIEKELYSYIKPYSNDMVLLDRQLFDIEGVITNGRHV